MMRCTYRRDERGAVAVLTAVLVVVLVGMGALAVDLGSAWARRGDLQVQADRAATFAAQFLPARGNSAKLSVAKAVAFYVTCHPVNGQRDLDPNLPACPSTPESPSLTSYAQHLLDEEMVTFPVSNVVRVLTPRARVGFAFAGLVGASHTIQQKQAAAKVTSPGMISPMALSLDCLLNTGANLLGGAGLPFGYVSTTHKGGGEVVVTTTWSGATQNSPTSLGVQPDTAVMSVGLAGPTVRISGSAWPTLGVGESMTVVFARGSGLLRAEFASSGALVLTNSKPNRRIGYLDVVVPAGVMLVPGTWEVKVRTTGLVPPSTKISTSTGTFTVTVGASAPSTSCGRLIKSPRGGTNANGNFALNLAEGLDHLIETYPTLVGTGALTRQDLLNVANVTECAQSDQRTITDINGAKGTPNCVVTKMSSAYEAGFTEGLIGPQGRLTCTVTHACKPGKSFVLNGRSINNDAFTDFVKNSSLLTASTFFNIDTFLHTGLPVVTPTSNLDRSIYGSHRFMWVAVISTVGATSAVQAGDYPVLTFRPIFVTQQTALDQLPLVGPVASPVARVVDGLSTPLLAAGTSDQNGLMMDTSGNLSAIRFLTISPDALPAVPADYTGPESEYLGVGPRIVRLVQ